MAHSHPSRDDLDRRFRPFLHARGPWLYRFIGDDIETAAQRLAWQGKETRVQVFTLDGRKMRSAGNLYSELAERLRLPAYCGHNFNAISECMTDPDVLKGAGFVLLFLSADQLLCEERGEMLEGFLEVLRNAGAEWASPVQNGQPWDREAVPFHAIMQMRESQQSVWSRLPSV